MTETANDNVFLTTGFDVAKHENGESLKLTFLYGDGTTQVAMTIAQASLLVSTLVPMLSSDRVVPLGTKGVQEHSLVSFGTGRHGDGVKLDLAVRLHPQNQVVQLKVPLSETEALELREYLSLWLDKSS
jgi:hypothetical protein